VRLLLSGANFRRHRQEGVSGFSAQVEEQGQVPAQEILEVGLVRAPEEVVSRLGRDEDGEVVVRRRLFVVNDEPVALCDSYYPREVADGTALAQVHNVEGGAYGLIEDPDGPIRRRLERSIDDLECRMPTPQEADLLRLPGRSDRASSANGLRCER